MYIFYQSFDIVTYHFLIVRMRIYIVVDIFIYMIVK